jgi:pyruvate/2-oxoglutarate/acetoin dehydrogenase E1 component
MLFRLQILSKEEISADIIELQYITQFDKAAILRYLLGNRGNAINRV